MNPSLNGIKSSLSRRQSQIFKRNSRQETDWKHECRGQCEESYCSSILVQKIHRTQMGSISEEHSLTAIRRFLLYGIVIWRMVLDKTRIRKRFRKVRGRFQSHTLWCFEHSFLLAPKQNAGNTVARLVATNQWRDLGVGHSAMNHILIGYIELEFQKPTPNGKCFFYFQKKRFTWSEKLLTDFY